MFIYLMSLVGVWGQSVQPSQSAQQNSPVSSTGSTTVSIPVQQTLSQEQATIQAFQQEQEALIKERQTLVAHGATRPQLASWFQQNAAQFEAQQQRAEVIAAVSTLKPMQTNNQPNIPANASQTLKDFLTTQAALANARAQIHNQMVQQTTASGQSVTLAQISQMEQQQTQIFQQQHAADLQLQAQRLQTLANESAQMPVQTPPLLHIPPNASPQLQAFLTTQNQLMQERIQLQNQYANAAPSVREAAMEQWHQQNAPRFQQLQQLAQNLSQASTPTQN
jgi:hypothetical protein